MAVAIDLTTARRRQQTAASLTTDCLLIVRPSRTKSGKGRSRWDCRNAAAVEKAAPPPAAASALSPRSGARNECHC